MLGPASPLSYHSLAFSPVPSHPLSSTSVPLSLLVKSALNPLQSLTPIPYLCPLHKPQTNFMFTPGPPNYYSY
ncbi:hypothetical protein JZ751_009910, partial [Albula glossodonta]